MTQKHTVCGLFQIAVFKYTKYTKYTKYNLINIDIKNSVNLCCCQGKFEIWLFLNYRANDKGAEFVYFTYKFTYFIVAYKFHCTNILFFLSVSKMIKQFCTLQAFVLNSISHLFWKSSSTATLPSYITLFLKKIRFR